MYNHESSDHFLISRLALTGSHERSTFNRTRLILGSFEPQFEGRPITGWLTREESEALQYTVVAEMRAAKAVYGKTANLVLHHGDSGIGYRHFLLVEFDRQMTPIRATDPWGFFADSTGEMRPFELVGSHEIGVFTSSDVPLHRNLLLDPSVLPVAFQQRFGGYALRGFNIIPEHLQLANNTMVSEAKSREYNIERLTNSYVTSWSSQIQRRSGGMGISM